MTDREDVVRFAGLSTPELGIEQKVLEAMAVKNRAAFILQKRVEMLKESTLSLP